VKVNLTLQLDNLSFAALLFAPLSVSELQTTNWLYLPPACLLCPLRRFSLRELRLSFSPENIRCALLPLHDIAMTNIVWCLAYTGG